MKIARCSDSYKFRSRIYIQRSVEEGGGGEFIVASRNGTVRAISSIGADVTSPVNLAGRDTGLKTKKSRGFSGPGLLPRIHARTAIFHPPRNTPPAAASPPQHFHEAVVHKVPLYELWTLDFHLTRYFPPLEITHRS